MMIVLQCSVSRSELCLESIEAAKILTLRPEAKYLNIITRCCKARKNGEGAFAAPRYDL